MIELGMEPQTLPAGSVAVAGVRVSGEDRFATSVALSKKAFPSGLPRDAIVVATGLNFPDALAVAPLAGRLSAPVLLVGSTLPPSVRSEIIRLYSGKATAHVYVAGGTGAVSDAVVSSIRSAVQDAGVPSGSVTAVRLAGDTRYGTAAAIAGFVGAPTTGTFAHAAIVTMGASYADALAISALAAREQIPILLVGQGTIPSETQTALATLGVQHVIIVGGTGVVGGGVEGWLESHGYRQTGAADNSLSVDTRLFGSDRYATSLEILDYSVAMSGMVNSSLVFATGTDYPDGLAAGPVAGRNGTPLVLIDGWEIGFSPSVATYLIGRRSSPPALTFIGGEGAISDYVRGQVRVAVAP
jgi:putative cell wall-binding protein